MDPQTYFQMQQMWMFQQQQMAGMQHQHQQQQTQTQQAPQATQSQPPQATQSQPPQSEDGPSQGRVRGRGRGGRGRGRTTTPKASRIKWPQSDEVLMAQAVYESLEDSILSTNQSTNDSWFKVHKHYSTSNPQVPRDQDNLKAHWHMVKTRVPRFNDLYLRVKSSNPSGWSDNMWLVETRSLFNADQGTHFKYEHIWTQVKNKLKYNSAEACADNQGPKRNKSNVGGYTSFASSTNFGENEFNFNLEDDDEPAQNEEEEPAQNEGEKPAQNEGEKHVQRAAPTRPNGRDRSKAAEREKKSKVDNRQEYLDQLLAIEQNKIMIEKNKIILKYYKLVNMDTSYMSRKKLAAHNQVCARLKVELNIEDEPEEEEDDDDSDEEA
ncbi:hypothetical protein SSX86_032740 [Deinandra increscens subsp. villosa]|uniref:No apical meristem-associated C-terminal domain-containing protein n=1 Tax=Deinandra increscens subsp. villosa TaxID=3103831 RepID=A0AAP0GGZ7_9ASTR